MKKAWKRKISVLAWGVALLLAGCVNSEVNSMITDRSNRTADQKQDQAQDQSHTTATTTVMTGKAFMLTAKASHQELAPGVTLPVWTFNNAVPGPEIRVRQGETIKVILKADALQNRLCFLQGGGPVEVSQIFYDTVKLRHVPEPSVS